MHEHRVGFSQNTPISPRLLLPLERAASCGYHMTSLAGCVSVKVTRWVRKGRLYLLYPSLTNSFIADRNAQRNWMIAKPEKMECWYKSLTPTAARDDMQSGFLRSSDGYLCSVLALAYSAAQKPIIKLSASKIRHQTRTQTKTKK
jgi:hypothetical protein